MTALINNNAYYRETIAVISIVCSVRVSYLFSLNLRLCLLWKTLAKFHDIPLHSRLTHAPISARNAELQGGSDGWRSQANMLEANENQRTSNGIGDWRPWTRRALVVVGKSGLELREFR